VNIFAPQIDICLANSCAQMYCFVLFCLKHSNMMETQHSLTNFAAGES